MIQDVPKKSKNSSCPSLLMGFRTLRVVGSYLQMRNVKCRQVKVDYIEALPLLQETQRNYFVSFLEGPFAGSLAQAQLWDAK